MTPIQSAVAAEHKANSDNLRILGANGLPFNSSRQPASSRSRRTQVNTLHTAFALLRSGWRWLETKRTQQLTSRRLRVTETVSLGEKRSVSIVQVDGAQFLIGSSASSVQLLAVLDRILPPASATATEEVQL
jgi:hypothetical protein